MARSASHDVANAGCWIGAGSDLGSESVPDELLSSVVPVFFGGLESVDDFKLHRA